MQDTLDIRQPSLPDLCPISAALEVLAEAESVEERGAVFTRQEVVDFILDLVGYTDSGNLHERRLLEPSFGNGDFLLAAISRLFASWQASGSTSDPRALGNCIRAVELHRDTFDETKQRVIALLRSFGLSAADARHLASAWLIHGDFLLVPLPGEFDAVVGNPPYVRQELIPDVLLAEYRSRYQTVYDRADLYIPFIERSLRSLSPGGELGFICADRWMKNRYGGPLRALVGEKYHLQCYVDMVDTPAFHSDVIAYPAITVISREKPGPTRVAFRPEIDAKCLSALAKKLTARRIKPDDPDVREITGVIDGSEPWIFETDARVALVRRLEAAFPVLEDAGCKVGIGVATGADKAYIGPIDQLDVEPDRKLPIVMTRDIMEGTVQWRGFGVINPFTESGKLVDLKDYPRLNRYLQDRKAEIAGRHVAQKAPANWYRTIDRITPSLTTKPKLLIPDIKGEAHVVYEDGKLYPHHNLYFVTSEEWDLRALQAVLLSGIAKLFVSTYSTKMRGGYLRFQAQYLRRIRVPEWAGVSASLRKELIKAAKALDLTKCNQAVSKLFELTDEERAILESYGE